MSFCLNVKEELSKINTYSDKILLKLELMGGLTSASLEGNEQIVVFRSEYFIVIKRIISILKKMYGLEIQEDECIEKNKNYSLKIDKAIFNYNSINVTETIRNVSDVKEIGAILRGVFLLGGTVSSPSKEYHLDIAIKDLEIAEKLCDIALFADINFKISQRKNEYLIYLKEASQISDFLVLIGASSNMLKIEEARVVKNVRNNVNRSVNCETANINKTVEASIKVVNDIKYIKARKKFETMPDSLKKIADLRQKEPNISLAELALMLNKPITKSGVKHRLDTISKLAEELRRNK